jgi:hypothetical protein
MNCCVFSLLKQYSTIMVTFSKAAITFVCILCFQDGFAQKPKPAPVKPVTVQKYAPPKLTSMLGNRADTGALFVEEAIQLVGLPLKVIDDKKVQFPIVSYQAMYRRRGVTEEEVNGEVKIKPVMTNVSAIFKTTPLPANWITTIKEQLRAGEELLFFDIVVKDAKGKLFFASDIKLTIK